MKVLSGPLDGSSVPNEVVQSAGPLDEYGGHPQDVQVLAWDSIARRWLVAFDARRVILPGGSDSNWWPAQSTPSGETLLPRGRADLVHQLRIVNLGSKPRAALVFTADVNAGANQPSEVVVVDFDQGEAEVAYCSSGDDLPHLSVTGASGAQSVAVTADLFTGVDSMASPARRYQFVLASTGQGIMVVSDDRPWLGIYARDSGLSASSGLPIQATQPGSPAARVLRKGDLLVSVDNEPVPGNASTLGPYVVDQLERCRAHDQVELTVRRGGSLLHLRLRLGSLLDPSAQAVFAPVRLLRNGALTSNATWHEGV